MRNIGGNNIARLLCKHCTGHAGRGVYHKGPYNGFPDSNCLFDRNGYKRQGFREIRAVRDAGEVYAAEGEEIEEFEEYVNAVEEEEYEEYGEYGEYEGYDHGFDQEEQIGEAKSLTVGPIIGEEPQWGVGNDLSLIHI